MTITKLLHRLFLPNRYKRVGFIFYEQFQEKSGGRAMNLTFKGFLRGYCRELTGQQTDNLRKLCKTVVCDQPAAAEALMIFAALQGKAEYLASFTMGTWLHPDYARVSLSLALYGNVEAWLQLRRRPERL